MRIISSEASAAAAQTGPVPDAVLLDGSTDWLTVPDPPELLSPDLGGVDAPPVTTRVKADMDCAAVAAASVLAKVERDGIMVGLAEQYPDYGWDSNKGYGSPPHLEAIRQLGPCVEHRRSWKLPT